MTRAILKNDRNFYSKKLALIGLVLAISLGAISVSAQ